VGRLAPAGDGENSVRAGQAQAARSRWKPSAIWAAHRQAQSMRRQVRRAELAGLRHQGAREPDLIYEACYDAFRSDIPPRRR
jgi:hypothetical protein